MKKYILIFILFGLISSCGPTASQKNELNNLISDWKNTSAKAMDLSQDIGDKYYLFQSKMKSEADTLEMIKINFNGNETNCEAAFEQMQANMEQFISTWQEKSQHVDELTNAMAIGKWTSEDQSSMDSLNLEVMERDVVLEQWKIDLEELNKKCELQEAPAETNETDS